MDILMILIDLVLLIALVFMFWPTVKAMIRWYLEGGKMLDQRMEKDIPVKLSAREKYRGRLSKN
jgi:hypothetical protein